MSNPRDGKNDVSYGFVVAIQFFFTHKQSETFLNTRRRVILERKAALRLSEVLHVVPTTNAWQRNRKIPEHVECNRLVLAMGTFECTFELSGKYVYVWKIEHEPTGAPSNLPTRGLFS